MNKPQQLEVNLLAFFFYNRSQQKINAELKTADAASTDNLKDTVANLLDEARGSFRG